MAGGEEDANSAHSKRSWFKKKSRTKSNAGSAGRETVNSASTDGGGRERDNEDDDVVNPLNRNAREEEWRLGDDMRQYLDL